MSFTFEQVKEKAKTFDFTKVPPLNIVDGGVIEQSLSSYAKALFLLMKMQKQEGEMTFDELFTSAMRLIDEEGGLDLFLSVDSYHCIAREVINHDTDNFKTGTTGYIIGTLTHEWRDFIDVSLLADYLQEDESVYLDAQLKAAIRMWDRD